MPVIHSLYREPGTIKVDEATCIHCGQCMEACPAEAIVMDQEQVRVNALSPFGCIACAHCMMVCPNESITVTGRGLSPDDLRPMPAVNDSASAHGLEALMRSRRSVRRFKEQDVAQELLDRIVNMAATAPMGIPPWDVGCIVIRDHAKVRRLSNDVIDQYEGLLRFMKPWMFTIMRPFMKRTTIEQFQSFILPLARIYVQGRREGCDLLFYDAPAVMIFHRSPYTGVEDATIACTYAMLAASALGLGTTIIGSVAPVLTRNKTLSEKWGIPKGNSAVIAMILGHPDRSFKRTVQRHFAHEACNNE